MATKKATTKKTTAKKAPAKKTAEKKAPAIAPAKKAAEKKAPATKTAEKAPVEKKAAEKKVPAAKAAEKKAPAAKAPEKKAAPAEAPAKKTVAKEKAPAKVIAEKKPAPVTPSEAASEPIAKPPAPPRVPSAPSGIKLEDAQKIYAEVQASRKQPKGPFRAAPPLRFTNPRKPSQVGDLNPNDLRQLVAAGAAGTGEVRTPEGWLDPDDSAESFYGHLEVWDVVDAHGIPVYAVWMYQTDNGSVFRAGSIDVVGGVSQGGLECAEEGLEEALLDAKSRLDKKILQASLLRNMG